MKKKVFILLSIMILLLSGCTDTSNYTAFENEDFDITKAPQGVSEWISPDGVHYWIHKGRYNYGMAPRYDSNGNLVVNKNMEE